jgi:hypothetical protein
MNNKNIRVPEEAHAWLTLQAKEIGTTIGEIVLDVCRAIDDYDG